MKKLLWGGCLLFFIFVIVGASFQRHALACEILPLLDYSRLNGHVFIGADHKPASTENIEALLQAASLRIERMYGEPHSRPRILVAGSVEAAERWGANDTATMHRLPWRTCIILGPEGENIDVLAHEWLHAEIQQRVGFWRFLRGIPVWFDEGAALTVDYREPLLPENITLSEDRVSQVRNLVSGEDFFSGNVLENYQAARLAVIPLITANTFYTDLERVAAGENFSDVFSVYEN